MKSLIKDIIFSFTCFAIIITASILLYHQLNAKIVYGGDQIGTITYKKEKAERKFSELVIWEKINKDSPIFNYDTIRTFKSSEAVIHLKSGIKISLDENTLIIVSVKDDKVDIDFTKGTFSAKRSNQNIEDILNIRTSDTSINSKKGDILLSKTDDLVNLNISGGQATISRKNKIIPIQENQSALIKNDSVELNNSNFSLISPGLDEFYVTTANNKKIDFAWEEPHGKKAILQISKTNSFSKNNLLFSRLINKKNYSKLLPPGNYYWRLKSAEDEKHFSDVGTFKIMHDIQSEIILPLKNSEIKYYREKPEIRFKWSKSQKANSYLLEIAKDKTFNEILSKVSARIHSISIKDLDKGFYFCRMKSIYLPGSKENFITGPISTFKISKKINQINTGLLSPHNRYRRSIISYNKKKEIFSWTENKDIIYYEFQLSDDKNFNYLVNTAKTSYNYYKIDVPLPQGEYFWRVKGYYSIEEKAKISNTNMYFLTEAEKIVISNPTNNSIIDPAETEGEIKFEWKDPNNGNNYTLYTSSDKKFTLNRKEYSTDKNFILIKNLSNEKIFWKVSLLDKNNNALSTSKIMNLTIAEKLKAPEGLSPISNVELPISYAKNIYFSWKHVEEATNYEFTFYKYKGAWKRLIINEKTKNNNFIYEKLKYLTNGTYYWEVRAIKMDGQKIIKQSRLQKYYFRIKTEIKVKQKEIEITSPDMIYVE